MFSVVIDEPSYKVLHVSLSATNNWSNIIRLRFCMATVDKPVNSTEWPPGT